MAVFDYPPDVWRRALGMREGQEPKVLVLEGTWWREKAVKARLSQLDEISELPFPDIFIGTHRGIRIAYCCAYGAPRAAEPAHVFAQVGTPLLIQIGTCGVLTSDIEVGTVVLPEKCRASDGVSRHYSDRPDVALDAHWVARAEAHLSEMAIPSSRTRHITWPSLFAQSDAMCLQWAGDGFASVDMETSVVAAVAGRYGAAAVSLLTAWDSLLAGRTFLDPLDARAAEALTRGNDAVFAVALRLAEEVADGFVRLGATSAHNLSG